MSEDDFGLTYEVGLGVGLRAVQITFRVARILSGFVYVFNGLLVGLCLCWHLRLFGNGLSVTPTSSHNDSILGTLKKGVLEVPEVAVGVSAFR